LFFVLRFMPTCLICDHAIEPFISFGRMPIANGFLTPDQFVDEPFFELATGFCDHCKMVQLTELVDPQKMFHEHYAFFSSTSSRMASHFQSLADHIKSRHLGADPFVVEIGSNDGIFLKHFASDRIRHLGIEPSANVAAAARASGVNTIGEFFSEPVARKIAAEYGHADVLVGANVMCHIPTMHSVVAGIATLLKPSGVLIFEDPYLGDIIERTSYDQIYDEHAFYFSVTALDHVFTRHGLEIIDVDPQATHGGSMRYAVGRAGAHQVSGATERQRRKEQALGLGQAATYDTFRKRVEQSRIDLMALLRRLRSEGKRVVGYGATSKSTTVINYCGISPDLVEFISDTTPIKHGKFSPGAHIPIAPSSEFRSPYPDYALLFAWNHADEIKANETAFVQSGGRWVRYVPQVAIEE
jgi:methylation protein EvaC